MMQAEVGVRILAPARNSDRGAVSVMLQQQFAITRLCNVPRGAFSPPPNVDSVVLKLEPRSVETPTNFEQVVRCGFSQPRKTLANNLASGGFDKAQVHAAIAQLGLGDSVRAHMLEQEQCTATFTPATTPSIGAGTRCSIFIASRVSSGSPSFTVSPGRQCRLITVPGIGAPKLEFSSNSSE